MNRGGTDHSTRRLGCRVIARVALAALLAAGTGCQSFKPAALFHFPENLAVSQVQVRLRMRALVDPMCGAIEQSADAIIAGTTNRSVQLDALRWKIEGVPAMREALFQPDPMTAVFDAWVLCFQMADYFEEGRGRQLLGESSGQAVATCRHMEEEMTQIAARGSRSGDVTRMRALARKWATEHPVRHSIAGRESVLSRVLEKEIRDTFSFGQAVAEMNTSVDDLNRRLEIYSDQLFRQARWEADLFKAELMQELPVKQWLGPMEQTVATVNRLAPGLERALAVAENAPKLVASERDMAFKAIEEKLTRTIQALQAERVAALEHVTEERIAALTDLHNSMIQERKVLTRDVEQIALKTVDHAMAQLQRLVFMVLAVLLVAGLLGLFLARRIFLPANRVKGVQS